MASKYADKLKEKLYGSGLIIAAHVADAAHSKFVDVGRAQGWPKARTLSEKFEKITVGDLRLVAGDHEFPLAEILQAVEDNYVTIFDEHVAEAVKQVVFDAELAKVQNVLRDLADRVDELASDLNGDVGRKIEKVLGPNAFWSESSGTC